MDKEQLEEIKRYMEWCLGICPELPEMMVELLKEYGYELEKTKTKTKKR